jgi:metal-dependent hydrolase (beta-lactamase superfamily II)
MADHLTGLKWIFNRSNRGYPVELAHYLPSITVKKRRYIDADLDEEWRQEYAAKRLETTERKWLKERVAERRVISKVSNFTAFLALSR